MEAFPILITPRLKLKKLKLEDLPALVRHANNRKIAANVLNIPHPYTDLNASMRLGYVTKGFKEKSRFCFAICLDSSAELIGEVSLHETDRSKKIAELGYWIGEAYWNNGYATEAVAGILNFGFGQGGFSTIYATCYKENVASQKVLLNNNMSLNKENGRVQVYNADKP